MLGDKIGGKRGALSPWSDKEIPLMPEEHYSGVTNVANTLHYRGVLNS